MRWPVVALLVLGCLAMGFSLFVEMLNLKVIELKNGGRTKDAAGKTEA